MFSRILSWIRQAVKKVVGFKNLGEVSPDGVVSSKMVNAIDKWMDIYQGNCEWLQKDRHTLGLPAQIASEIARLVTLELEIKVSDGNDRGKFISSVLTPLVSHMRPQIEYACAGGGLMFRPFVDKEKVVVCFNKANRFVPTAFDSSGNIFGCDFIEHQVVGNTYFTRIERHYYDDDGRYNIDNLAYRSSSVNMIGTECSLTDCPAWREIEPKTTIDHLEHPLFSYFKIPLGNTIDPESPLGVSVFARAISLIRDADEQYQRLTWEFEGGELAIDASSDAFGQDPKTKNPILPTGKERLYRMNDLDCDNEHNELLKAWTPTLRDTSYLNGLDEILTKIEDQCGLSRGTLCKRGESQARTAEEIRTTKQRSYATVSAVQTALQDALEGLVKAIDELADLYELVPPGEFTVSYKWDDSIVVDAETERVRDQQEVSMNLMMPWEYRVKWYGETEEKAKSILNAVDAPSDDQILGFGQEDE